MSADDKHNEMRSDYHADANVDDDDKLSVNQIMSFFRKKKPDPDNLIVRLCTLASLVVRKFKPRIKAWCLP